MKKIIPDYFKNILFLSLTLLIVLFSCQKEEVEITELNNEEAFDNSSAVAQSMFRTATFDGSADNIIDSANCLSINLPVTIQVNGITFTIGSVEDYDELEDILEAFDDDDDEIVIQFPITITLSNYEQIVINSQPELNGFVEDCMDENEIDDDIECIDFQYPISISLFNSNFDNIDTVSINSDEALYNFLEDLEDGVLANINYPVTMILADGSTITVNSNSELQAAIEAADDTCDEDDDYDYNDDDPCFQDSIEYALIECFWRISDYNDEDIFEDYFLKFNENYGFLVLGPNGNTIYDGNWTLFEEDGDFVLNFETDWDDLNGDWIFSSCDDDEFYVSNGQVTMEIEQKCEEINEDPLGCLEANAIMLCDNDNDGVEVFNLYEGLSEIEGCSTVSPVSVTYHTSEQDAEVNANPISNVTSFTNTSSPQTIYVRIEVLNNTSQFEVLEMELYLEDCSSSCTKEQVDQYLTTCTWNVADFNGSDDLSSYDFDFSSDGTVTITGNGQTIVALWSTSQSANGGVEVEFSNVNLGNIQAISGNWLVTDCQEDQLEFGNYQNVTMVMEQDDDC